MNLRLLVIISSLLTYSSVNAQTEIIFNNGMEFIPHLNDTGITWAGEYPSGNNTDCTSTSITSPQDCHTGRDYTHNDDSDGHAGFSFTKLDAAGIPLVDQTVDYATTPWACVKDNVTGLVWEVKTTNNGLHNEFNRFNWYNTNPNTNGGTNGYADDDGNICYGYNAVDSTTYCNTQAFIARVNLKGLCGNNDWRLPNINELLSIVNQETYNPAIDTIYFPNTILGSFWSSNPSANPAAHNISWALNFRGGWYADGSHFSELYVRLVRDNL